MSSAAHLILSLDYEVLGNGSGDLECCVLQPAERIASVAEPHEARLSVSAEALEFAAMEQDGWPIAHLKGIAETYAALVAFRWNKFDLGIG